MSVLIADDDRITTRVLEKHLRQRGYEVRVVHAGSDAWNELRSEKPPLVAVLDWSMPGASGPELCRRVRERAGAPFTYLMLCTGRDQTIDVMAGMNSGADDYVKKPFDLEDVAMRVHSGVSIALERRSQPPSGD